GEGGSTPQLFPAASILRTRSVYAERYRAFARRGLNCSGDLRVIVSHEFAGNRRRRDANIRPLHNRAQTDRLVWRSDSPHSFPHQWPLRIFSRRALLHRLRSTPRLWLCRSTATFRAARSAEPCPAR